jgi:hypothetical protein
MGESQALPPMVLVTPPKTKTGQATFCSLLSVSRPGQIRGHAVDPALVLLPTELRQYSVAFQYADKIRPGLRLIRQSASDLW